MRAKTATAKSPVTEHKPVRSIQAKILDRLAEIAHKHGYEMVTQFRFANIGDLFFQRQDAFDSRLIVKVNFQETYASGQMEFPVRTAAKFRISYSDGATVESFIRAVEGCLR